jgi:pimeloyl-ACP methyl ester carboxylesterase
MSSHPESAAPDAAGTSRGGPAPVIFLPGILMPPELRYPPLLAELGETVRPVLKTLEVYSYDQTPPPGYSIEMEVEGISRVADEAEFDQFHLYGHSGGGACALAYTATYPERVLSLALDEPATDFSSEARAEAAEYQEQSRGLPADQQLAIFVAWQFAPDAEPPPRPDGPAPEWMATRPAGIEAILVEFDRYRLDVEKLQSYDRPVYYSYGGLSNPSWQRMRDRLAAIFPDFTSDRYEDAHHMRTSHAIDPARVAAALKRLWARAPQSTS